jgi:ABC-type branched-subunit amino acid transport system substrate-binding protein
LRLRQIWAAAGAAFATDATATELDGADAFASAVEAAKPTEAIVRAIARNFFIHPPFLYPKKIKPHSRLRVREDARESAAY